MEFRPHEYQRRAVEFVLSHRYCALFMAMGLGKTAVTLTAVARLLDECEAERVLVVAPKKVAESTWGAEAAKWDHLRGLRVSVVLGDAKKRERALAAEADLYVTSRDLFPWLAERKPWAFDMVVIDELTSFKNSASLRFRAFRRVRPLMRRVVGLTGTPTPNGLADLWAQFYCIDQGESLGRFKGRFLDTYFSVFRRNNIPIRITPKAGAEKAVYAKISSLSLTLRAEDWLRLPEMLTETVRVALPEEEARRYRDFERERVLELAGLDEPLVAANAAGLCNKLAQFANGAIYLPGGTAAETSRAKMDALMELVEAAHSSGESALVFYQFRHDWERAAARPELRGMSVRRYDGDDDLRAWNAGGVDVLFAHAAATAYGLNMQAGGHVVVWYGTGFNAELYLQGNARLHRQGQTLPTRVYRLAVADTVDDYALAALDGKVDGQAAMLDFLSKKLLRYGFKKN